MYLRISTYVALYAPANSTNALVLGEHTVLGWHVADIDEAVKGLVARGVIFEIFVGMPQDELGIWASPSGEKVAWFKDPDGNNLSLTQFAADNAA
jgi:hypothetical protein